MRQLSILVVDDEETLRGAIVSILERRGHQVIAAGNVASALRYLDDGQFDVIVTDMLLGADDGIAVIRKAREKSATAKIIAMSGGGELLRASYVLNLAVAFGAKAPLLKPFSADELFAAVEEGDGQ